MTTQVDPPLSACHNAPTRLVGGIGDFHDDDRPVTMHYECTKCGEPCDLAQVDQNREDEDGRISQTSPGVTALNNQVGNISEVL